jgi:hypothetical protein
MPLGSRSSTTVRLFVFGCDGAAPGNPWWIGLRKLESYPQEDLATVQKPREPQDNEHGGDSAHEFATA